MLIHLEDADGEAVWWAEVPELPGFSAAAPTLADMREQAHAAIAELVGAPVVVVERLAGDLARDQNVSPVGADRRPETIVALVGV